MLHKTALLDAEGNFYQAICTCGWFSSVGIIEEIDLLSALHTHKVIIFQNSLQNEDVDFDLNREGSNPNER